MDPGNELAAMFEVGDESSWRGLVKQSLRGNELDSLVGQTDDGISLGPIYSLSDRAPLISSRPGNTDWAVVQRIDDPNPSRVEEALAEDLNGGATGIELVFSESCSANRSGFGLTAPDNRLVAALRDKDDLHLRIDAGEQTYAFYETLKNVKTVELTLAYDQLAHAAARGGFDRPLAEIERDITRASIGFHNEGRHGAAIVADGRHWAAGGASEAQELAGILGSLVHNTRLLIEAGLSPEQALNTIGIVVDGGASQVIAIAKMRALRLAHARIVEEFGCPPMAVRIHAETSWRMMTGYAVHTNILRTASATFAAGIGGANSITVLSFTSALGVPDLLARRIARNSQIMLLEEAGLARVSDPGAGSGAIESLTAALAAAVWKKFQALEAKGGLLAALRSGTFQHDIAMIREARANKIGRREITITGISEFPNLDEPMEAVLSLRPTASKTTAARTEAMEQLVIARFSQSFETLRDRAAALAAAGSPPKVFLACLGEKARYAEPTQAAVDFFAAGGMSTIRASGLETPEAVADAFAKKNVKTACIVCAENSLFGTAARTASMLKERGATRVFAIGGMTQSAAIDAVLDEGGDAIKVLSEVLDCSG